MPRFTFRALVAPALVTFITACTTTETKVDTLVVKQASPPTTTRVPQAVPKAPPAPVQRVDTVVEPVGTLHLRNPNFGNVNVEVRIGANADCNQNAAFGTRQLQRGAAWTITANQDVCWRRDANPDAPNGTWGSWNRQAIGKGTTHEATL